MKLKDPRDYVLIFTALFGFVVLGFAVLGAVVNYGANQLECNAIHDLTGEETRVTLILGCVVKQDGRWVDGHAAMLQKLVVPHTPTN